MWLVLLLLLGGGSHAQLLEGYRLSPRALPASQGANPRDKSVLANLQQVSLKESGDSPCSGQMVVAGPFVVLQCVSNLAAYQPRGEL